MRRLVFDIETVGIPFDDLSKWDQQYFLEKLEKPEKFGGDEKLAKMRTGLYPLYAQVVSIAYFDVEKKVGGVHIVSKKQFKNLPKNYKLMRHPNEKSLIAEFWDVVAHYDQVITFNGRGFDAPFLLFRSMTNQLTVRFDLMPYRYAADSNHVDLYDQLGFYGATRAYSLEAYCRALGIINPKTEAVSGMHVANLYIAGKHQEIVDYVIRDVEATTALYALWKKIMPSVKR